MIAALLGVEFGQEKRKFHILERREHGNEIECLENISDVLVAPARGLSVVEPEDILSQHKQFAGSGPVNGGNHVQHRCRAGTGRAHQRQKFAAVDFDGNVVESLYLKRIAAEHLGDVACLNDFGLGSCAGDSSSAHVCPLILIFAPSFKSCGAEEMTSSPPLRPSTSWPPLRGATTRTSRASSSPFSALRSRMVPVIGARMTVALSCSFAYAAWPSA